MLAGGGWLEVSPRSFAPKAYSKPNTAIRLRQQRISLLLTERTMRSFRVICSAHEHCNTCATHEGRLRYIAGSSPAEGDMHGAAPGNVQQQHMHC